MSEESKTKLMLHEITIVGKLKNPDDKTPITLEAGASHEDMVKAIRTKFKFVRVSEPSKTATDAGVKEGEYIHIRMADPGGDVQIKNGKTFKLTRKTTEPGYDVLFKSVRAVTFNEIKQEIINGNFEPVAGDLNSGEIILTQLGLIGYWDKFPLGFDYFVHFYDPKQGGKLAEFMSPVKQDDGTYKKTKSISNTGQHFVYEDEYDNLEFLREQIRKKVEKWKVPPVLQNVDPRGVKDEPAKPEITPPVTKTDDDV
jgi:hypothetical protein